MSVGYRAVQWSRHKRRYDGAVVAGVLLFIVGYALVTLLLAAPGEAPDPMVLLIRATGSCALTMLGVVLAIGPLARLDRRFLPVLFNRRHLGVATFLVGLAHAALVMLYYHGFGTVDPLTSLLVNSTSGGVPFELFGAAALLVLFLMAATSHDYWLKVLSPPAWKALHMLVYGAAILLVAHVAFGALHAGRGAGATLTLGAAIFALAALHLIAGRRERLRDTWPSSKDDDEAWIDAGPAREIPDGGATVVVPERGERIAVFREGSKVCAVTNVCAHQNGPLGEGRIVDGCITCPWHGWQYRPEDGCSPPPFEEKIATHDVRMRGGRVLVRISANPPGTRTEPGIIGPEAEDDA